VLAAQGLHRHAAANLYQSLHTTSYMAAAIRSADSHQEMHRIAEEGVAAHWKYKDGNPPAAMTINASSGCAS